MPPNTTIGQLPTIPAFDHACADYVLLHLQGQARPPGALERLERIAAQVAGIQGTQHPSVDRITAFIFAGDHGLTQSGVSAFPSRITAAMVTTFLNGRASANALAAACGVNLTIVDAGVDADLTHPDLISAKVARGTHDATYGPAMTSDDAIQALVRGVQLGANAIAHGDSGIILGEMGIGNTAASALLIHRLAPAPLVSCVGPGAGCDSAGLEHKHKILELAAARSSATEPFEVLCEFGGFEIAMMAGAALGAASKRGVVIVDGFISTAAALLAVRLSPNVAQFCIYAHRSGEPGHGLALDALKAEPLLDLGLRLGEGTGAILAAPLVRAATRLPDGVASLKEVAGSTS